MKPDTRGLYEAASLCSAIASLATDLERDPEELNYALIAIRELATTAHDQIDYGLRGLNHDPGIGYADPIRAELDEAQTVTAKAAPK